jgi:ABC-type amino acid transport substrate-binding protein
VEAKKIKKPLLIIEPISQSEAYIAANKNFPSALAEKYRGAETSMHADGTIQKIANSYSK